MSLWQAFRNDSIAIGTPQVKGQHAMLNVVRFHQMSVFVPKRTWCYFHSCLSCVSLFAHHGFLPFPPLRLTKDKMCSGWLAWEERKMITPSLSFLWIGSTICPYEPIYNLWKYQRVSYSSCSCSFSSDSWTSYYFKLGLIYQVYWWEGTNLHPTVLIVTNWGA